MPCLFDQSIVGQDGQRACDKLADHEAHLLGGVNYNELRLAQAFLALGKIAREIRMSQKKEV